MELCYTREIYLKNLIEKNIAWIFEPHKLYRKSTCKNVVFATIEITSEKVCGNNVDFSTSKIIPVKVRGNNVDFSNI